MPVRRARPCLCDIVGRTRSASYVTFDDALQLAAARANPQDFVLSLPDPVVLDEVQRAPEVFRAIKLSVDRDRRPGRFLLTGSANVLLLPRLSESLAGRMRRVMLWPLSQGEIESSVEGFIAAVFGPDELRPLTGADTRASIAARIARGGFPEAVALPEGSVRDGWMRDYVATLLDRDVREITAVTDRVGLPRLLRLLAVRSATLLNASDLSRRTGIPRATIDRYMALFTTTFTVRFIPAWAGDVAKRLVRSPKILFVDSGTCAHLNGVDAARMVSDPDRFGLLFETFVGGELVRQIEWAPGRVELMHYRDGSGAEVDWVLEDSRGRLVGIEVKSTSSPGADDFKGLRAFAANVGARFHRGVVLHTGRSMVSMGSGFWAMPVEALWRLGAPSTPIPPDRRAEGNRRSPNGLLRRAPTMRSRHRTHRPARSPVFRRNPLPAPISRRHSTPRETPRQRDRDQRGLTEFGLSLPKLVPVAAMVSLVIDTSSMEDQAMALTIPQDVLMSARMSESELRQEIAVMLFQREKLTLGQASAFADMDRVGFQHLLASRRIPQHYDAADFEEDLETFRGLDLA